MATVKITPQLDTKPALKSFNKLKKDMTNPSNQAQMSKLVRSFDFRKQLSDVGKMHTQFSKMAASSEKSQKRQEISAKIERIRKYKAIRDELSFQNKKETSIKRQSNLSKAYQRMDLIGSAGGGMAMAAGLQSHIGQYQGGGFSSLIQSQMSTVAGAKNYMSEKYQQWKADREEKKQMQGQQPSSGQAPKKSTMGGFASSLGAALPMAGVIGAELAAKTIGAISQVGSDMAEAHMGAMASQSSTMGATMGYVGISKRKEGKTTYKDSKGNIVTEAQAAADKNGFSGETEVGDYAAQGYFHNSEVAQAQVEYSRARGTMGNKRMGDSGNMMKFAAQQGVGLSSIAQAMGSLGRAAGQDIKLEYIKGAATASKVTGLKQAEFFTKFAGIVEQNRAAGFGEINQKEFLQQSANLGGSVATPERGLELTSTMNQAAQKGEKGGTMGSLALAAEMQSNGGDYFAAKRTLAEKGMQNSHADFIRNTIGNNEVGGHILNEYGFNQNEGEAWMQNKQVNIKKEAVGAAGSNKSIELSNIEKGYSAGNATGAKIAEQLLQASLTLKDALTESNGKGQKTPLIIALEGIEKTELELARTLSTLADRLK